jgi:hypothetical protein
MFKNRARVNTFCRIEAISWFQKINYFIVIVTFIATIQN